MVASTAFAAGIIDSNFFAVLVLLAILTSLAAGAWLERVPRHKLLDTPRRDRRSSGNPRTRGRDLTATGEKQHPAGDRHPAQNQRGGPDRGAVLRYQRLP